MTSTEALAEALDWAEGRKSHWNEYARLAAGSETTEGNAMAQAACAQADAAEVVKWSALAGALAVTETQVRAGDPSGISREPAAAERILYAVMDGEIGFGTVADVRAFILNEWQGVQDVDHGGEGREAGAGGRGAGERPAGAA